MPFDERNLIVLGAENASRLARASVAVYGLGGVGAACAMDLVRSGVGRIVACDLDLVKESNLNRLYFGYAREIGRPKAEVFAEYALQVNPDVIVESEYRFFSGADARGVIAQDCAVHVDCIDSLTPKTNLLAGLASGDVPFISCLGTGGRIDPARLRIVSIWDTRDCPLAAAVRSRLRKLRVTRDFPVVWSDEPAAPPRAPPADYRQHRPGRLRMIQGSLPFVPQAAGHLLASWALRTILDLPAPLRSTASGECMDAGGQEEGGRDGCADGTDVGRGRD